MDPRPAADVVSELLGNPAALAMLKNALQAPAAAEDLPQVTTRWMINVKTGALIPATVHNVTNPDLTKYTGSFDAPISPAEGMAWLIRSRVAGPDEGDGEIKRMRDIGYKKAPKAKMTNFDLANADVDVMRAYGSSHYNVDLEGTAEEMREALSQLARVRGN